MAVVIALPFQYLVHFKYVCLMAVVLPSAAPGHEEGPFLVQGRIIRSTALPFIVELLYLFSLPAPGAEGGVAAVAAGGGNVVQGDETPLVQHIMVISSGKDVRVDHMVELDRTAGSGDAGGGFFLQVLVQVFRVACLQLVYEGPPQHEDGVIDLGHAVGRLDAVLYLVGDAEACLRSGSYGYAFYAFHLFSAAVEYLLPVGGVAVDAAGLASLLTEGGLHQLQVLGIGRDANKHIGLAACRLNAHLRQVLFPIVEDTDYLEPQFLRLEAEPVHEGLSVERFFVRYEGNAFRTVVQGPGKQDLALCDVAFDHGPEREGSRVGTDEFVCRGYGEERFADAAEGSGKRCGIGAVLPSDDGNYVIPPGQFFRQGFKVRRLFIVPLEFHFYPRGAGAASGIEDVMLLYVAYAGRGQLHRILPVLLQA